MHKKKKRPQNKIVIRIHLEHKASEEIQRNRSQRTLYKEKAYRKQTSVMFILSFLWPIECHQANHFSLKESKDLKLARFLGMHRFVTSYWSLNQYTCLKNHRISFCSFSPLSVTFIIIRKFPNAQKSQVLQ